MQDAYGRTVKMVLLTVGVHLAVTILGYVLNLIYIRITNDVTLRVRYDILSSTINSDYAAFAHSDRADINTNVMIDVNNISALFGPSTITLLVDIIKVVVVIVMMFLISLKLTLITFVQIIPAALIFLYFFPKIYRNTGYVQKKLDLLFCTINNYINGLKTIKLLSIENSILGKMYTALDETKDKSIALGNLGARSGLMSVIFIVSSILTVWLIGGYEVFKDKLTIGDLVTIQLYLTVLGQPIQTILSINSVLGTSLASIHRILDLFAKNETYSQPALENYVNLKSDIVFDRIHFDYKNKKLFRSLSFTIKQNSLTAIVGKSGIGKSTLAHLIIRSIEVEEGTILINNTPINEIDKNLLRKNICLIEGNSVLFGDTLEEALMLPPDKSLHAEAAGLLKKMQLDEFAALLLKGETLDIGINGEKISDGQKHRLTIVRSILQKPGVLIIDEALSSLDIVIEHNVINALKEYSKHSTIILITHSLNFLDFFDFVILLKQQESDNVVPYMFEAPRRETIVPLILGDMDNGKN